MADEQYEWLDADAAEMLLRGEPVEPVGDHARTEARRLEAALGALRIPGPPGGELPGEAAVLAAFREASGGGKRMAGEAGPAGLAGQDALHTVRIGTGPAAPRRRPRWSRPVRYGLAVSLAGCALGGVAVAAGTGMLPAPFGGHGSPVPATSVSAAASPEELETEVPDAREPAPPPSGTPRAPRPPAPPDAPEGGTAGGDGPAGQDGGGTPDREDTGRDSGTTGGTQDGTDGREVPGDRSPAEVYKKSVKACRDYREDALSPEDERRLLRLADGERNLDRFCDRLLNPADRDGGSGADEDGQGDDKNSGGGKGGDGEGSLPSITFRTQSAEGHADDAPQDGPDARPTAGPTASSLSMLLPATR
ncbi:hypothetical protein AB0H45_24910 [Streptomyces atroolivaceus]|uniref:hypothetical protein n=1 Tax=Streptomyces atroolivaceus TaxID=66869 RepID=UPI0033D485BC